jgi:hypothetical protein
MDSDSNDSKDRKKNNGTSPIRKQNDVISDDSNVSESSGFRHSICYDTIINWIITDYGYYFLLPISTIFWIIFVFAP